MSLTFASSLPASSPTDSAADAKPRRQALVPYRKGKVVADFAWECQVAKGPLRGWLCRCWIGPEGQEIKMFAPATSTHPGEATAGEWMTYAETLPLRRERQKAAQKVADAAWISDIDARLTVVKAIEAEQDRAALDEASPAGLSSAAFEVSSPRPRLSGRRGDRGRAA